MIDIETKTPAKLLDSALVEEIATQAQTNAQFVQETYSSELNALAEQAKITQFLSVIALRRVRRALIRY